MTWLEKVMAIYPKLNSARILKRECPADYFTGAPEFGVGECKGNVQEKCEECWNQEYDKEDGQK